jgi:Tol biopolymer transport system component/predicted Ser/Thr protein kinase
MTLSSGSRLGPYEIVAPLGAGGMGEVYRARDTRLDRTVAIKVLPDHLSSPEARQRFEREAKTISQLSHPHICALYDVGHEAGVEFLVMEFLDGETLADRLGRGPLPIEQAMRYGIEIAEALDRAHRAGVVHRDLKPGNVMLTKSGVKLLDFGLAKLTGPPGGIMSGLSMMPTTPKGSNLTAEGTILGTFQYMAPEQLEGKEADSRTDVFAFGAVFYEMVTGRKAFGGAKQVSLIASILEKQPEPISIVQPTAPPALDRIVRKCLAKDPEDRWQSAADLASELKWSGESSLVVAPAVVPVRGGIRIGPVLSAIVFVLLGLAIGFAASRVRRVGPPERSVFSILPPEKSDLGDWTAISPEGRSVAFVATLDGTTTVWIRSFDSASARSVPGTEGGSFPFWSPDARSIGFFATDKLKRINLAGGPATTLCDAPAPRGGSWSRDGVIVFGGQPDTGLLQVPAAGGSPSAATSLDKTYQEITHRWPEFLPDGKRFTYFIYAAAAGRSGLYLGELGSNRKEMLVSGARRGAFALGHLFFARAGTLLALKFDAKRPGTPGDSVPVAERVWFHTGYFGHSSFSVARTGAIAFREGSPEKQLTWFDRSGKRLGSLGPAGLLDEPALSPDETRISVNGGRPEGLTITIWAIDLPRGSISRLIPEDTDASDSSDSVWSPDGRTFAYRANRAGKVEVHVRDVSSGREDVALRLPGLPGPIEWTLDGKSLICGANGPTGLNLWLVPITGDRKPRLLLNEDVRRQARISPDGRFFAYASDESGGNEVYLRRFPPTGERWQVSQGGGVEPHWRGDGREIFYITPDRSMTVVPIRTTPAVEIGKPESLFPTGTLYAKDTRSNYVVTRDGQRFLITVPVDQARPTLTVIENALPGALTSP